MDNETQGKIKSITRASMAIITLASVIFVIVPAVSGGTGYETPMHIEKYQGNIPQISLGTDAFGGKSGSKLYEPVNRITSIKIPGIERQWTDAFGGKSGSKLYEPVNRITSIKIPGIERQWTDAFGGKSGSKLYEPAGRITTINILGIQKQWKDTYNGKSYVPSLPFNNPSIPSYPRSYPGH